MHRMTQSWFKAHCDCMLYVDGGEIIWHLRLWWVIQMSTTNTNGIDMRLAQNQKAEFPQISDC